MIATSAPFSQYFDKSGDPLDSGYVYFGVPDANPETSPIPAYWDEAGTQPVAQPARTLAGYIVRNGTPARVYVEGAYSQTVKNKKGELVYYAANSEDYSNLPVNVATIEATDGQTVVNLPFSYTRGNNSLAVYLNGTLLLKDRDYIETSETAIQMLNPLQVGPGGADEVTAIGGRLINPSSAVGMVSAAALAAGSGAGLVGYDASLTFPADTVGERLQATTYTVDAITSVDATALGLLAGDVIVAKGRTVAGDVSFGYPFLVTSSGTADGGTLFDIGGGLFAALMFVDYVDVRWFGAVGDGSALNASANVTALNNAKATVRKLINGAIRQIRIRIPAGYYFFNANIVFSETGFGGGFNVEGDGELNTILEFTTTSGDAITVQGNFFSFVGFSVYGSGARKAGSGRGIFCGAGLSTTSYRGRFRNIRVVSHAEGMTLERVEHHSLEDVLIFGTAGVGLTLDGGAGLCSWNTLINVRTQQTGGKGIVLTSTTQQNTLIHPEALEYGVTDTAAIGIDLDGRSNTLINLDSENPQHVTGATSYVGVRVKGSRHNVIGGYIGDCNKMISLESATLCEITQPVMSNTLSGVAITDAVTTDASCSDNTFSLPTTVSLATNVLTPSAGRSGDIIRGNGTFGRSGTWTAGITFGGAAVGLDIGSQTCRYVVIGKLCFVEFDITLSLKGSSTGAAKITGLPFASAAGSRGMVNVQFVSGGSSVTNTEASAVAISSTQIDLRAQGASSLTDITNAVFTDATRLVGSATYTIA